LDGVADQGQLHNQNPLGFKTQCGHEYVHVP
jgi:hypothetical protein